MARPKKTEEEILEIVNTEAEPIPGSFPVHYEEWRMEKVNGKLEKLKMLRPKVKITEDEAATLNAGAENGQGVLIQYFLPETN